MPTTLTTNPDPVTIDGATGEPIQAVTPAPMSFDALMKQPGIVIGVVAFLAGYMLSKYEDEQ